YRITTPFIYHNEHIGVLEFGIKPNYFIDMLKREFDIQAITIVKSDFLNNLDFKKQYPKIDNYSIVTKDPIVEKIKSSLDLNIDRQIIDVENKTYLVLSDLNLLSFNNQIVSKIIIIKDITNFVKENNNALMFINSLTFMVFLLVLSVIYIVLTKFYKEIEEHTQTISTLHKESKFLQNKANTDDLTKAFNKRYFDQFLVEFLDTNKAGVIIFFDIDHFKNINDTHGHLVGDKILTKLSATVKEYLREDDIFVRWGGEEFIVLIEDITPTIGVKKAEELRKLVEKTLFANELKITISLGVTMIEKNDTKEKLLKRVDTLLYKAKDSGRNCVVSD
ncbi:MAG: GGDEF domain-containing protein, partial [Campylobacterota bacterium]|nr:GGDEF domain-containing protein [Campylobacterota bacterium]